MNHLRTALEAILADAEDTVRDADLTEVGTDVYYRLIEIAGTARMALSFDDADAVRSK